METQKFTIGYGKMVILAIIAIVVVVGIFFFFSRGGKEEFQLIPKERIVKSSGEGATGTEVGTGWSVKENPEEAVKEAVDMALKGKADKTPDFTIIFASSGSDMEAILSNARKLFGNKTKIYGGASDSRAVMTDKGFVKVAKTGYKPASIAGKKALAVMTITSKDIIFGVGSVDFSAYASVQEASKAAILNAIKSAGKSQNERPKVILTTPVRATEDGVLEGIEQVCGKNTLILGGTAGGPQFAVFGEDRVYDNGVSLAVIYTDLPIGWTFEGGFDVTAPQTGIITRVNGSAIIEIDNRPALDVYDEWLDGEVERLNAEYNNPRIVRDLLTLHPFYRKYASPSGQFYFLFSHPWPKDSTLKDRAIMTSTNVKEGERIYLSHGTWETFINRIGNLPRNAKVHGGLDVDQKSILGIGYVCAGVMGVIPETERDKLPLLINYANNDAPFIAAFTWGEQGFFPGIGNKHGNLLTSFLVIGNKK